MKKEWFLISMGSGVIGGILVYFLTKNFNLAWFFSIAILIFVLILNPIRRYMRAFYVVSFPLLANIYFTVNFEIENFNIQVGFKKNDLTINIILGVLSVVCLVLDFFERKNMSLGNLFVKNKISNKNILGDNINITQRINEKTINDHKINRVNAVGDNIFVFQYMNSSGEEFNEKKSFEEFLKPFIDTYTSQIEELKARIKDKSKIENCLDKEVLLLSKKINDLENEKKSIEDEVYSLLNKINGMNISESSNLYQKAFQSFIDGSINEALSILDNSKMEEEENRIIKDLEQKAKTRMFKARLLKMKNEFEEAGKHYEIALKLETNWINCFEVANFYSLLYKYREARHYFQICLKSTDDEEEIISTLNSLGVLEIQSNELGKAEQIYNEVLRIIRKLFLKDPKRFSPNLAGVLDNLGILNSRINKLEKAEKYHQEALKHRRKLTKYDPETYLEDLAVTLNNLGVVNDKKGQLKEAKIFYIEAIDITRKLILEGQQDNLSGLANLLDNFGILSRKLNELEQAEQFHFEALKVRKKLASDNPHTFLSDLAKTLNNLGALMIEKNEFNTVKTYYEEAIEIRRKLVDVNPKIHIPELSVTLINMGMYYQDSIKNKKLSIQYVDEAIRYLLPFNHLPLVEHYLNGAFNILRRWGIDTAEYMKNINDTS